MPANFTTQTFNHLLMSSGFFDVSKDTLKINNHLLHVATLPCLSQALSQYKQANPKPATQVGAATRVPSITLLGQTHNCPEDLDSTKAFLSAHSGSKKKVILERNGNVHPKLPDSDLYAEVFGTHDIATENLLACRPNGGGFETIPLSHLERGWLIGMYAALSLANNPEQDITIVAGDAHSQDILNAFNASLDFLGMPPNSANISYKPSHTPASDKEKTQIGSEIMTAENLRTASLFHPSSAAGVASGYKVLTQEAETLYTTKERMFNEEVKFAPYNALISSLSRDEVEALDKEIQKLARNSAIPADTIKLCMVELQQDIDTDSPLADALIEHAGYAAETAFDRKLQEVQSKTSTSGSVAAAPIPAQQNNALGDQDPSSGNDHGSAPRPF